MALIRLAPWLSEASGKLGSVGVVYQSPTGRTVSREYVNPTYAPTSPRAEVSSALAAVGAAFSSLTTTQVDAWQALADNFRNWDRLGQDIPLSGHDLFVRVNMTRRLAAQSITTTPPPLPPDPPTLQLNGTYTIAGTWPIVVLSFLVGNITQATALRVRGSFPFDSPNRKARLNEFRFTTSNPSSRYGLVTHSGNFELPVSYQLLPNPIGLYCSFEITTVTTSFLPYDRNVFHHVLVASPD